jgi:hypothetical protein
MMQLALPKQNGCLKCVVQLDTKANERRGSRFPNFFASTQSNSCDEFLGEASRRCAGDQRFDVSKWCPETSLQSDRYERRDIDQLR